jgi:N-acetyltransferase
MKIEKVVLEGKGVRLEPLAQSHLAGLARAIEDGALWQVPVTFVPHPNDLLEFLSYAESAFQAGRELAFATLDKPSNTVVGSTRFRCAEVAHKRVEIGFTFLAQSFQRTRVNTEAKLLMLAHAFEVWQVNRVELLTDVLNEKSRNAIARLGAQQEGVIRSHMVMRDGRVRDSVLFSIIKSEWPKLKSELERKLAVARP